MIDDLTIPSTSSFKSLLLYAGCLFIPDLAVEEVSHVFRTAFYSGFRIEKLLFIPYFDSKNGIKSNLDLIEIRNKKQNTHVMPEKHLKITLFGIRNKKLF